MKFIAINTQLQLNNHDVISVNEAEFYKLPLTDVDYVIVSGGDGLLRRVIESIIFSGEHKPKIIVDAKGSFNVIAKKHLLPKIDRIVKKINSGQVLKTKKQPVYKLNNYIFLFSAGNMFDALHIHLAEMLRVGLLKKGPYKYLISAILIAPVILLTTPFLLFSSKRFFIFTPFRIFNFQNFYTKIEHLKVNLENNYNLLEIDGDLIIIENDEIEVKLLDYIDIVYN